jgi:hypothetical protein
MLLLAAAAALVLLAVSAEILARWWIRRGRHYVFPPGMRLLLHPHPAVFPQLESAVRFDVNGDGERGDAVPRLRPRERLYRVLVAGGSQPEGYLLDQHTSWPGALQRLLEAPAARLRLGAARVHVGSIARSGVGSEGLHLILRRVLPRYRRLQAIVVLVGASDVLRWLEEGAPAAPPSPVRTADVFRCHPGARFGWAPGRLAAVELARRWRRRWLRPVDEHDLAGSWVGKARTMRAQARVIRTTTPDPAPMLAHFERELRAALRLAGAHAERVLVVRQPWFDRPCTPEEAALMWHGGAGQAWKEEVTTYFSHDVLSRLMAALDSCAARVAEEAGVEQLDLRPLLPAGAEHYYDFFHATPAGARIVAGAVAATVLRQPLASASGAAAPKRAS